MNACCRDCRWWGGQAGSLGARCHRADTVNTMRRYPESPMHAMTRTGEGWLWTVPGFACTEFTPRDSSCVPPDTAGSWRGGSADPAATCRTLLTMAVGHLLHPDDYGAGDRASLIVQIKRYLEVA